MPIGITIKLLMKTRIYTPEMYMRAPITLNKSLGKYLNAVMCQTGAGQCDIIS